MDVYWSKENWRETYTVWSCLPFRFFENREWVGEIRKMLIAATSPNERELNGDIEYYTPLHSLATCCNVEHFHFLPEVISLLLSAGAMPNLIDSSGDTPLHYMIREWPYHMVSAMVSNLPQSQPVTSILDVRGGTLLHAAASSFYCEDIVSLLKMLVDAGIGVNRTDSYGRTALHYACYPRWGKDVEWSDSVVYTLLDLGADILATDNAGRIPMHYLFLPYGIINDRQRYRFFSDDFCRHHPNSTTVMRIANFLLSHNSSCLYYQDRNGRSPLFYSKFWTNISLADYYTSEEQIEKFRKLTKLAENIFGLCFYFTDEKLRYPFSNLQFRTQGRLDENKLRAWAENIRRRYSDPDVLVTRVLHTPGVGPPSLLEETSELKRQIIELMTRLTASAKDIYPGMEKIELVGSCREGTKASLPDEFDFRVKVKLPQQYQVQIKYAGRQDDFGNDKYTVCLVYSDEFGLILPQGSSGIDNNWYIHSDDGVTGLNTWKLATSFVDVVTVALTDKCGWEELNLCLLDIKWGNKALTLLLEWTGSNLFEMCISVDLVIMLCIHDNSVQYISRLEQPNIPITVLRKFHSCGWQMLCTRNEETQISFSDLESDIFHNIPSVICEGFQLAKTLTRSILTADCGDSDYYKPSSFLLKLSLFDLLDPDRTYFLLEPDKCTTKFGAITSTPGRVREWAVTIYRNLRQQLLQTQYEDNEGLMQSKLRCYFVTNITHVNISDHAVLFCDVVLSLLGETCEVESASCDGKDEQTTCLSVFPHSQYNHRNCFALTCFSFILDQLLPSRHVMSEIAKLSTKEYMSETVNRHSSLDKTLAVFYSDLLFDGLAYPRLINIRDAKQDDIIKFHQETDNTERNKTKLLVFPKDWEVVIKDEKPKDIKLQLVTEYDQGTEFARLRLSLSNNTDYFSNKTIMHSSINSLLANSSGSSNENRSLSMITDQVTFGYRCRTWPEDQTAEWQDQASRRTWPGQSVVDRIIAEGCHVVPNNTDTDSLVHDSTWQFTFVNAERILASTLTLTQRQCFMLISLVTDHLFQVPTILTPVLMKSVFFQVCETIWFGEWEKEIGLAFGFLTFFHDLGKMVTAKSIPYYFMPDVNLLAGVPEESLTRVRDSITAFRSNPLGMLFSIFERLKFHFTPDSVRITDLLGEIQSSILECNRDAICVRQTFLSIIKDLCIANLNENRIDEAFCNVEDLVDLYCRYFENMSVGTALLALSTAMPPERYANLLEVYFESAMDEEKRFILNNLACAYSACAHKLDRGTSQHRDLIDKCDDIFQKALASSFTNYAIKCDYALFLIQQNRWEDAVQLLSDIIESDKEMCYDNVYTKLDIKGFDDNMAAEIIFADGFHCPSFALACYHLIQIYKKNGQHTGMFNTLKVFEETCLNRYPLVAYHKEHVSRIFSLLGYSNMLVGHYDKASLCFTRALQINPIYSLAKENRDTCDKILFSLQ